MSAFSGVDELEGLGHTGAGRDDSLDFGFISMKSISNVDTVDSDAAVGEGGNTVNEGFFGVFGFNRSLLVEEKAPSSGSS